jgi:alkylation response protein AidB-like acyl-CoA dehydrogenase
MPIALTDTHRELENVARAFLENVNARAAARALLDAPTEELPKFWDELAELGWLGLHLPEDVGGSGYGLPELVVVLQELGRGRAGRSSRR